MPTQDKKINPKLAQAWICFISKNYVMIGKMNRLVMVGYWKGNGWVLDS